jgi:hypothetical protein
MRADGVERSTEAEARAIADAVARVSKPVDPDLSLAKEVVAGRVVRVNGGSFPSVNHDDLEEIALAAIKRVRAEQQEAR